MPVAPQAQLDRINLELFANYVTLEIRDNHQTLFADLTSDDDLSRPLMYIKTRCTARPRFGTTIV